MKNKLLLLFLLFMFGMLVATLHQNDIQHELEIQSYRNRLIKTENRYLEEKRQHDQTKLDLALTKRIVADKDKLMQEFVTSNYAGEFEVTYYTSEEESTGKNPGDIGYGITKSGEPVLEGYTAAADWDILEPGTKIFVEGIGFRTITDSGSAIVGNKLDIFVEDVDVAIEKGRHAARVYVLGEIE